MQRRRHQVRLSCEGFPDQEVQVSELDGVEGISRLYEFEVLIVCPEPDALDVEDILLRRATLIFERYEHEEDLAPEVVRRVHGVVAEARDLLSPEPYSVFKLRIVPRFWLATLVETLDLFLDKSVTDIVRERLTALNLVEGEDFELWLTDTYPERDLIVQYKETDHAFLSRLLEHVGVSYYIEQREDRDVVIFCDHNRAFGSVDGGRPQPFRPRGERVGVHRLEVGSRVVPQRFVQRDYNYRNPQVDVTGQATIPASGGGAVAGAIVEYGGHCKDEDEARWFAEIRAQEQNARRRVFDGSTDLAVMGAGLRVTVTNHPRGDLPLLLTEVRHRARQTTLLGGFGDAGGYGNEIVAILESTAYRPPRVTPRPRIGGVLTAVVDAESRGQYAELDDQGRYRVKFMFDTSDAPDGKASRLVRMMQPHSGPGYGMHFPLRPGVEVLITFMDGDPDRPIIAGTVPNPQTSSPITSANATKNILRTGGGNEIQIDDKKDSHRIKMMTPTSNTTFQLGAPNDPEQGAMLSTLGASTTVATTGLSAAGAFASAVSLITDYSSSGDVVTVAKKPGLEAAFTLVVGVVDALVTAVKTTIEEVDAGMDLSEKRSNQEATKATEAATAAQAACKACRDEAIAALPPSRKAEIDALKAKCDVCTGAHPSAPAGQTCKLSAAEQKTLADATAYEAKRDAAVAYAAKMDEADALHDTALLKRWTLNVASTNASTQSEDMHDVAAGKRVENAQKDYDTAYAAYTAKYADAQTSAAAAKAPYATSTAFAAFDAKSASCAGSCANLDRLRANAAARNKAYNDLVTAHGPHKNQTKEAKTYLGVWASVPPLFSAAMFIYTKLKKSQKAVEALALWQTGALEMVKSTPRKITTPGDYTVTPKSPKHVLGAQGSMHLYGAKDLLMSSETMMILGAGVKMDPTDTAEIPDPTKGKVAIVGGEEVRVASKGEIEIAGDQKVLVTTDHADVVADQDVEVKAPHHKLAAQMDPRAPTTDLAKLLLDAAANLGTAEIATDGGQSFKMEQKRPAKTSEITAVTPGTIKLDAGAKIAIEAADEIKLSIKNGGPSITLNPSGITLKVGQSAQILMKADQVLMKYGGSVICRLSADKAMLKFGGSHVVLDAAGGDIQGPKIKQG
ncbi:MAG: type VI secretion system tip protein TssI/VgrG [Polyangiaceae bacterium]